MPVSGSGGWGSWNYNNRIQIVKLISYRIKHYTFRSIRTIWDIVIWSAWKRRLIFSIIVILR